MTEPPFLTTLRSSYDRVAADYAERFRAELDHKPLDRALLAAFAELVRAGGAGPVADIGCGPGHVTAHLHGLGLNAFGVDVSAGTLALARRAYPGLRFDEGSMLALGLADAALGGIVALYSIIHVPRPMLPTALGEFHRVLAPGGWLLLAFQVGDGQRHLREWLGHPVELDFYLRSPDEVAELLTGAGLAVHARLVREPEPGVEAQRRAYLLAVKPPAADQARLGPGYASRSTNTPQPR